ncbi:MAG TPA: hypothetical protein VH210_14945 [Gaiellaceae bacterium]|jgi:hypothetical protein|nr:hypothetical protein [Gaiellaceae bacterium]
MSKRDLSFEAWESRRGRTAALCARIDAALPPFQRERLRSREGAEFLRSIGTPENLIGRIASDDELDREWADMINFARELRAHAAGIVPKAHPA